MSTNVLPQAADDPPAETAAGERKTARRDSMPDTDAPAGGAR
ncbi:hypothetical protein AB0L06_33380 [Spirillospora sp. NPDC052269]